MNLPNYFLADVPDPATLTPTVVSEACQALKRNRAHYLAQRGTGELIEMLAALAEDWLDPANPFRRRALELGPAATGFPAPTLAAGLDAFFEGLTVESLGELVLQDLGHPQRLDRFSGSESVGGPTRLALARGPELLAHITGGVLPAPPFLSLVLGLLARAGQFVKCASGTSLLPCLFAHSLYEIEPKLAACIEIAEWKGGHPALEEALFAQADCVAVMGTNETLAHIRPRLPISARFLGYGHRVSFGYLAHEMLSAHQLPRLAAAAAADVCAWNQLGCLSPHLFYVETGGRSSPEQFAEQLAAALESAEAGAPRGTLPPETAAAIASRRSFYDVRAAHSTDTRLWCSPESTAWTVVYERDPRFQASCLNRFVYVKAVTDPEEALQGADGVRGQVSTIGLAATGTKEHELALRFARWGATRICPLGRMQRPPPAWRHDGRPSLGDLITWTDWELPARW